MKIHKSIRLGALCFILLISLNSQANSRFQSSSRTSPRVASVNKSDSGSALRTSPTSGTQSKKGSKPVNARTAMDLQAQLEAEAGSQQKRWSTLAMYNVSTDMAMPERPRNYTHVVGSMILYRFNKDLSAYGTFSGKFISMGREVRFEEESDSPDLNDVLFGLNLPRFRVLNGNLQIGSRTQLQLPASQSSRYEGIRWVWSGQVHADTSFFNNRFSVSTNMGGAYKQNTYDYSPTTDNLNTDVVLGLGLDLSFQVGGGVFLAVGASQSATHHIDNLWTSSFTNQMVLGYVKSGWRAQISYFNGSYPDDPTVDLWYVDQYRQLVRFTTSYSF